MAREATAAQQDEASVSEWIKRLEAIITAMEAMGPRERMAALVYMKSKYREDWPSDSD